MAIDMTPEGSPAPDYVQREAPVNPKNAPSPKWGIDGHEHPMADANHRVNASTNATHSLLGRSAGMPMVPRSLPKMTPGVVGQGSNPLSYVKPLSALGK